MTTTLPATVAIYIRAVNDHDPAGFIGCFSENAVVNDAGRELRGIATIQAWSDTDIFQSQVTLEVLDLADRDGESIVTTKIDGNYDKTGLPDPLVMNHRMTVVDDKIERLTIEFASEKPAT
jgi:hypothetical protein